MDRDFSSLNAAQLNPDSNADRPQRIGVATVLDAVDGIRFPIDKEALMRAKGEACIDLTGDRPETLRLLLLRTDATEFLSVTDLVQKIQGAI